MWFKAGLWNKEGIQSMKTLTSYRLLFVLMLVVGQLFLGVAPAKADPYPPYWQSGSGPSVHFQPEDDFQNEVNRFADQIDRLRPDLDSVCP